MHMRLSSCLEEQNVYYKALNIDAELAIVLQAKTVSLSGMDSQEYNVFGWYRWFIDALREVDKMRRKMSLLETIELSCSSEEAKDRIRLFLETARRSMNHLSEVVDHTVSTSRKLTGFVGEETVAEASSPQQAPPDVASIMSHLSEFLVMFSNSKKSFQKKNSKCNRQVPIRRQHSA